MDHQVMTSGDIYIYIYIYIYIIIIIIILVYCSYKKLLDFPALGGLVGYHTMCSPLGRAHYYYLFSLTSPRHSRHPTSQVLRSSVAGAFFGTSTNATSVSVPASTHNSLFPAPPPSSHFLVAGAPPAAALSAPSSHPLLEYDTRPVSVKGIKPYNS
eukprot:SAG11_NODE_2495_length_3290_cov_25.090254_2_plen_156_part_00